MENTHGKAGVGPNGTLVSYTAICAHQLSYPTKEHTPINYTGSTVSKLAGRSGMIVCCEHYRIYDPSQGGKRVVSRKEATQSLAAIVIEHDAGSDEIYALGVVGGFMFDEFFRAYKQTLLTEYGPGVAREEVTASATAILMSKFTKVADKC